MRRPARRALRRTLVLGAAGALLLAGCGVNHDSKARVIAREDVPFHLADTTTTLTPTTVPATEPATTTTTTTTVAPSTSTTEPSEVVELWFVQGDRLVRELRTMSPDARTNPNLPLDALVSGPTTPGATSLVTTGVLSSLEPPRAGTVKVGLGQNYFALTPAQATLALGQVVLTLTQRPGIGRVQFVLGEQPAQVNADVVLPDGTTTSGEVSAEDYSALRAA